MEINRCAHFVLNEELRDSEGEILLENNLILFIERNTQIIHCYSNNELQNTIRTNVEERLLNDEQNLPYVLPHSNLVITNLEQLLRYMFRNITTFVVINTTAHPIIREDFFDLNQNNRMLTNNEWNRLIAEGIHHVRVEVKAMELDRCQNYNPDENPPVTDIGGNPLFLNNNLVLIAHRANQVIECYTVQDLMRTIRMMNEAGGNFRLPHSNIQINNSRNIIPWLNRGERMFVLTGQNLSPINMDNFFNREPMNEQKWNVLIAEGGRGGDVPPQQQAPPVFGAVFDDIFLQAELFNAEGQPPLPEILLEIGEIAPPPPLIQRNSILTSVIATFVNANRIRDLIIILLHNILICFYINENRIIFPPFEMNEEINIATVNQVVEYRRLCAQSLLVEQTDEQNEEMMALTRLGIEREERKLENAEIEFPIFNNNDDDEETLLYHANLWLLVKLYVPQNQNVQVGNNGIELPLLPDFGGGDNHNPPPFIRENTIIDSMIASYNAENRLREFADAMMFSIQESIFDWINGIEFPPLNFNEDDPMNMDLINRILDYRNNALQILLEELNRRGELALFMENCIMTIHECSRSLQEEGINFPRQEIDEDTPQNVIARYAIDLWILDNLYVEDENFD